VPDSRQEIRRLCAEDAPALAAMRRRALECAPWAFESGPGDDRLADLQSIRELLHDPHQAVFGAYEGSLVGFVGVTPGTHLKMAHRLDLWGLFVDPALRGRGIARELVQAAIDFACSVGGATSLHLSVTDRAPEAATLYRSLGFAAWGVQPDAIHVDGVAISETHMVLELRPAFQLGNASNGRRPSNGRRL
jgi:ribosomal protein S18 acetylase RimI-like enzyme